MYSIQNSSTKGKVLSHKILRSNIKALVQTILTLQPIKIKRFKKTKVKVKFLYQRKALVTQNTNHLNVATKIKLNAKTKSNY
jgi:hypothetical protein